MRPSLTDGPSQNAPEAQNGWGGADRLRDLVGKMPESPEIPNPTPVEADVSEAEAEIRLMLLMLALFPMGVRMRTRRGPGSGEDPVPLLSGTEASDLRNDLRATKSRPDVKGARTDAAADATGTTARVTGPRGSRAWGSRAIEPGGNREVMSGSGPRKLRLAPAGESVLRQVSGKRRKARPGPAPVQPRTGSGLVAGAPRRKPGRQSVSPPGREPGEPPGPASRPGQSPERHLTAGPERSWSAPLEGSETDLAHRLALAASSGRSSSEARARGMSGRARKAGKAWRNVRPGILAIAVLVLVFVTCWPRVTAGVRGAEAPTRLLKDFLASHAK